MTYQRYATRAEADTVKCPKCGAMNATDAKYCDQCGAAMGGTPTAYSAQPGETDKCPSCGKMNATDAKYCDQCGAKMAETKSAPPPRNNLIRARFGAGVELRDNQGDRGEGDGVTMFGHFSVFNSWYEVDSFWEGTFLEQVSSSAFDRTMMDDRAGMKVLFDHGFDPELGNKPLGPIDVLRADDIGAYYEVPLLDTGYNRDFVLPALRGRLMSGENVGSQLGASFRFQVLDDLWEQKPEPSMANPGGMPQRTIMRAQVMEFGPVTFPASPAASAGVRSLTDSFIEHLHNDPAFLARFTDRVGPNTAQQILSQTGGAPVGPPPVAPTVNDGPGVARSSDTANQLRRKAKALLTLER